MKSFLQMSLVALLLSAIGCGERTTSTHATDSDKALPSPYHIVTTCGMVTDIVRQVVGDLATVTGIMGSGVDPHLYKPTTDDVKLLMEADAIFYSGLMLEGRMADSFMKVARRGKPVYAVTELVDESNLLEPPEFDGHWDPHLWMDVEAWSMCVMAVATALAEIDAEHADVYRSNAATYVEQLDALDAYAKQVIGSIPEPRRVLITAHDAFNYFGRAYKIDVRGIQGISTESEAGLSDINALVDLLVDRQVSAIFTESSVSEKNIAALQEGAARHGHDVAIGGELFSDAMGAGGSYEGTYIGMIDHNATIIARALGGDAPIRGMQGKLAIEHEHAND